MKIKVLYTPVILFALSVLLISFSACNAKNSAADKHKPTHTIGEEQEMTIDLSISKNEKEPNQGADASQVLSL